jgi:hypothetical protein
MKYLASKAWAAALAAAMVSGSALAQYVTVTDPTRLTQSGFLSDYARLKPTDWGEGIECWRDPGFDGTKYDKVMISRIVLSIKPKEGEEVTVDPADLKTLTDYFHDALVKSLKPQMSIVTEPQPGTVVIRVALTRLVPTQVSRSLSGTLIPYGFVAEAGSGVATGRPAGSTPYLGETGMEMQFLDGASAAVLGECRDTEIGRKYAADTSSVTGAATTWASGYFNSFQAWSYAKNAFDKWAELTAKRFAALRGEKPAK